MTLSKDVAGASITLLQQVKRGEELLVSATVRVAFVSEGRAKRIPDSLRQATLADAREAEALGEIRR